MWTGMTAHQALPHDAGMRAIVDALSQQIAVNWMRLDTGTCCSRVSLFVTSFAGISLAILC